MESKEKSLNSSTKSVQEEQDDKESDSSEDFLLKNQLK